MGCYFLGHTHTFFKHPIDQKLGGAFCTTITPQSGQGSIEVITTKMSFLHAEQTGDGRTYLNEKFGY